MTVDILLSALEPHEREAIIRKLNTYELQAIVGYADTRERHAKRISESPRFYEQIELTLTYHEPF